MIWRGVNIISFNYLKDSITSEKSVLHVRCVFHVSLQPVFNTFFFAMNIWRVTLEMCIETNTGLHGKCPLLFSEKKLGYIDAK
jgi:hypothetical protein